MPEMAIEWSAADMKKRLEALQNASKEGARDGLQLFAEFLITRAKQITPVQTGALRASGYTKPAEIIGEVVQVELGFSASYAIWVHEHTWAKHAEGQAKFLEQPMLDAGMSFAAKAGERVGSKMKEAWR